jgi:phosphoribosylaminoimidazole-succinocarboxamide synthase
LKLIKISEGKTKEVFKIEERDDLIVLRFKDTITANDGKLRDVMRGKGEINRAISSRLFRLLEAYNIKTHYIADYDDQSILVRRLDMMPVEVVSRLRATGSIVKRLPIREGEVFDPPLIEFFYKSDEFHDPLINYNHMEHLKIMTRKEAELIEEIMKEASNALRNYMESKGLTLYDFKLEFGRDGKEIIVGDEISLDSMRIRDSKTGEILDKDLYRKGYPLDVVLNAYKEAMRRIVS